MTAPYGPPAAPGAEVQQMLAQARSSIKELHRLGGDTAEAQSWLLRAEEAYATGILSTTRIYAEYALGAAQGSLEEIQRLMRRIEEDAQRAMDEAQGRPEVIRYASIALELVAAGRLDEARDSMRQCENALREMESRKSYASTAKARSSPGAAIGTCPMCGNFVQREWVVCKYCETPLRAKDGRDQVERAGSRPVWVQGSPTDAQPPAEGPAVAARAIPGGAPAEVIQAAIAVGFADRTPAVPACPSCGESLEPSWRKCPNCSTVVSPAEGGPVPVAMPAAAMSPPAAAPGGPRCPVCDEGIEPSWRKCANCQALLSPSPSAGAPAPAPVSRAVPHAAPVPAPAIEPPPVPGPGVTPLPAITAAPDAPPAFATEPPTAPAISASTAPPSSPDGSEALVAEPVGVAPAAVPVDALPVFAVIAEDDQGERGGQGEPAVASASVLPAEPLIAAGDHGRRCVNCGAGFPEDARFCGSCGAPPPP